MRSQLRLFFCVSSIFIFLILLLRINLAINRFVDPDEFAHLHWTYLISRGNIPYRDFFINHIPVFFWLNLPLILPPPSSAIIVLARLWQFFWYLLIVFLVFRLARVISKRTTVGVWAVIIFLVFPMTFDKSLEFRPDTPMTALFLLGLDLLLETSVWTTKLLLAVGFLLGASTALLPKIAYGLAGITYVLTSKATGKVFAILWVVIGFFLPWLILLGYVTTYNILPLTWENIIHGSYLIKQGERAFSPLKALSPFPLVYVERGGISLPWLVNTTFWLATFAGAFILIRKNFRGTLTIFLVLLTGLLSLFVFPTPYLQYFIPLTALGSALSAAMFDWIINRNFLTGVSLQIFCLGLLILLGLSFGQQYELRVKPGNRNDEQKRVIDNILTISRPNETVYDMVGSYIFRPDGYYVCCNIYSQFADQLQLKLPTLRDSLVAKETKFIMLDRSGKSLWLPKKEDLDFMLSHYLPSSYPKIYTLGQQFSCQNGSCTQVGLDNHPIYHPLQNEVSIIIAENYKVVTNPAGESVAIDGKLAVGNVLFLGLGLHRFSVPQSVTALIVQLDR